VRGVAAWVRSVCAWPLPYALPAVRQLCEVGAFAHIGKSALDALTSCVARGLERPVCPGPRAPACCAAGVSKRLCPRSANCRGEAVPDLWGACSNSCIRQAALVFCRAILGPRACAAGRPCLLVGRTGPVGSSPAQFSACLNSMTTLERVLPPALRHACAGAHALAVCKGRRPWFTRMGGTIYILVHLMPAR